MNMRGGPNRGEKGHLKEEEQEIGLLTDKGS